MNILSKIVSELKYRIPQEVLRVAFQDQNQNWRQAPISIDEQIMLKVIRPRVIVDCNLVGGQTVIVSLEGLTPNYIDRSTLIFEIPADRLMFRTLISVLSIGYLPFAGGFNNMGMGMGSIVPSSMNDVMAAGQRAGDSMSNMPIVSNASVELVGYNTIVIRDQQRVTNAYQLRCVVANEENLNNINPRSHLNFAKLVELAVKSYIYNKLIIAMDTAYLHSGQELGAMRTYVEGLADSEQMYQDYLKEVIQAVSFMNDSYNYDRFIKLQICPGI